MSRITFIPVGRWGIGEVRNQWPVVFDSTKGRGDVQQDVDKTTNVRYFRLHIVADGVSDMDSLQEYECMLKMTKLSHCLYRFEEAMMRRGKSRLRVSEFEQCEQ